ncbi:DUF5655 domain-containing protein [Reichenbachiella sp. MALMAid0571]|uniref:DUF5655 domain-containing protein n=1 Tax=Reichenbachiella sp. MALMAid0571 TaxID=3143939 RepID=UPI0032DE9F3F
MWICPNCNQKFLHTNQWHSCAEKTVEDFLTNKSPITIELFHHLIEEYNKIGEFALHPAKSRIAFAATIRFGYIARLGRNFVDAALTFNQPYKDNLCFYRIGEVPGGKYFQHYFRIFSKEDINEELKKYMKMALDYGNKKTPKS